MAEKRISKSGSEWPTITENHWYTAAISLLIIGGVATVFCALWIFGAPTLRQSKLRADLLIPFGTIFLAIVTFCTVAWRGQVTSRQADQQKRQNDANDEANLAKLLQEGTKLVAEGGRASLHAGVATLEAIFSSEKNRFGKPTMNILAWAVETEIKADRVDDTETVVLMIYDALNTGKRGGYWSYRKTIIEKWQATHIAMPGLLNAEYHNGRFEPGEYNLIDNSFIVTFVGVILEDCFIKSKHEFRYCRFVGCTFTRVASRHVLGCTFVGCDFTGARFDDDVLIEAVNGKRILTGGNELDDNIRSVFEALPDVPDYFVEGI